MPVIDDGGPAFSNMTGSSCGPVNPRREGMSLRDYFACHAMMGLLAHKGSPRDYTPMAAIDAYRIADAMIAARSEETIT